MVYLFLAPGFEESEAVVPADLLRQAEVETALVSLSGNAVAGAHNITVQADLTVDEVDLDQAEMLVFPGGGTGVENLWNDDRVSALIQEAARRDIWLAALCAGPILLGRWGLLDGRKAVSYPPGPAGQGPGPARGPGGAGREVRHRTRLRLLL